jgi:hypothetical protein
MFFKPRANFIESDEGFSVEVLGLTGLRYCEGERSMKIVSELLSTSAPAALMVAAPTIRAWDPPHEKEPIDDDRRMQIVENIRRAFREADGVEIEVAW